MKARFMKYVEPEPMSGCWLWTGATTKEYGVIRVRGKNVLAHRMSYTLFKGEIPEGMLICHSCDTPSCVNPDHLWVGTTRDNSIDAVNKGRITLPHHVGDQHHNSKLTWEQVREIRRKYFEEGFSQVELSSIYETTQANISIIVLGRGWKEDK